MADDSDGNGSAATVVTDRPVGDVDAHVTAPARSAQPKKEKKGKKQAEPAIDEYEIEFETPFGKLEFEFEPKAVKERKDRERKEKAEADAAKAAEKAAKKAEKRAAKGEASGGSGGGGKLLPVLIIIGLAAGAVLVAYWLFARPEAEDEIPAEFRADSVVEMDPAPQGFFGKARTRIREAVRAGRKASMEAQREQEKKFEDLTRG